MHASRPHLPQPLTSATITSNTMSPIDTGRYNIVNARFLNCAVLPDANDDSDVIARSEENNPGEKVCLELPPSPLFDASMGIVERHIVEQ